MIHAFRSCPLLCPDLLGLVRLGWRCTTWKIILSNSILVCYAIWFSNSFLPWKVDFKVLWQTLTKSAKKFKFKSFWPNFAEVPCGALNWSPSSLSCPSLFGYHKTILGERQKSSLLYSMVQRRNHRRDWWDSGLT